MKRHTTRITALLAALMVGLMSIFGASTARADTEPYFLWTESVGQVTFHNHYDSEVTVSYTDDADARGDLAVPANGSATLDITTKHLMFSATIIDETGEGLVGQAEWPGIDTTGDEPAEITGPVSIDKPGSMTWINENNVAITIDYGDNADLQGTIVLQPGDTYVLKSETKHLMWSASIDEGLVDQVEWPGVDLSIPAKDKPADDKPAKDKPAKKSSKKPSLPNTGV